MDPEERARIVLARGGDVQAFSDLVERYWKQFVRFSSSIVGPAEAEDTVQEALLAVWDKLGGLREPEAFPFWALRILARRCFRHCRWRRLMLPLAAVVELADPGGDQKHGTFHVEQVLARLPSRQRAVMHLTVIEGMSDTEIAAALGIEPSSVRSHRRRAREALQTVFAGLDRRPTGGG